MKYAITLLLAGLFSLSAMAHMHDADEHAKHLTEALNLNEEQTAQVSTLLTNHQEKAKALFKQLAELKKQTDSDIKALLTSDQATKFEEMQQRHEQRMSHHKKEAF